MHGHQEPVRYSRTHVFTNAHTSLFSNRVVLDGDFEIHSHDFIELVVVASGHGVHDTIHGAQPLKAGDVCILHPGAWHAYRDCRDLEVRNCCVGPELLHHELAWVHDDPLLQGMFSPGPLGPVSQALAVQVPDDLRTICRHLDALHRLSGPDHAEHKAAYIGHLLIILAHLAGHRGTPESNALHASRPLHEAVVRGVQFLDHDLAHPWTLGDLAEHVQLDRSYLTRLFKAHTGLSPIAYLARQRAERAALLLLQTSDTVAQVGEKVGWPDPNYFARRFRAHFGVSATAYRARYSGSGAQADHTHSYVNYRYRSG